MGYKLEVYLMMYLTISTILIIKESREEDFV